MPTPLSAAEWSNWGWRYPNIYSPPAQGGPQQQTTQNWQVSQQPGMPSFGVSPQPTTMPQDQSYLTQAMMQQYLAQLRPWESTESKTKGAELGMGYAEKLGLTSPAEPDPSMQYRTKSALADALRNVQTQTARSGMPLSSVRDQMQENVIQQSMETLSREEMGAQERKKALAAALIQGFAR